MEELQITLDLECATRLDNWRLSGCTVYVPSISLDTSRFGGYVY